MRRKQEIRNTTSGASLCGDYLFVLGEKCSCLLIKMDMHNVSLRRKSLVAKSFLYRLLQQQPPKESVCVCHKEAQITKCLQCQFGADIFGLNFYSDFY